MTAAREPARASSLGGVIVAVLGERARARCFAELGAAIAGTTGALHDGYAAESAERDVTNEDGTPDA